MSVLVFLTAVKINLEIFIMLFDFVQNDIFLVTPIKTYLNDNSASANNIDILMTFYKNGHDTC